MVYLLIYGLLVLDTVEKSCKRHERADRRPLALAGCFTGGPPFLPSLT
jgi:hypothetical protein